MTEREFKQRTKAAALRVIRLVAALPRNPAADVLGRQLLRSGTSVGANYRAACRARSRADVISMLGIVEEEADESVYWLELFADSRVVAPSRLADLTQEYNEILALTVASQKTLRVGNSNPKSKIQNRKSKN